MAEVSKESIENDVSTEGDVTPAVGCTKENAETGTVQVTTSKDCGSETNDEPIQNTVVKGDEVSTADSKFEVTTVRIDVDEDDNPNSETSEGKPKCNGNVSGSDIAVEQIDDSVTVIPGNQEMLISVDVDKLMKEGENQDSLMSNGHVVDDDDDDDDDIVEVPTPSEHNVEECGEWSVKSRLQNFVRWCRSKGFIMSPKIEVTSEGTCHRYGMIATNDIRRGEVICSTPRAMIFNPDNSRIVAEIVNYEDWLDTIGQSLDESSGWATLLIALMVEYNDSQSFWAPYLRLVPKPDEYGHPLFWSIEEHKDELRGTTLLYDIQRDIYNIESEYKQFVLPFIYRYKDICGNVERYSLGLYKRLVAFVMAYSFTEDYGCEPNMIPLADILNHHSTKNNAKLVFGDDAVEVIAIKDISKGDEILNTFGKLGNAELLQTYGYADKEPNVYDTLPILVNTFLDVMEKEEKVSDSYFQAKISLLNKTEIAHSDDFFLFDRNGMRRGPDLIQMFKILFMPEEEFNELLKQRAGNRPDSFYQKLLRKLKLSKRTDTSSGVAVIDIIESDDEIDNEVSSGKRKMEIDEIEIDDGEPPSKQSCDMPMQHVPVVRLSHRDPDTFMNNPSDNGDSVCNAILIDDDDDYSGDESEVPMADEKTSNADTRSEKAENNDNSEEGENTEPVLNVQPSEDQNEDQGEMTETEAKENENVNKDNLKSVGRVTEISSSDSKEQVDEQGDTASAEDACEKSKEVDKEDKDEEEDACKEMEKVGNEDEGKENLSKLDKTDDASEKAKDDEKENVANPDLSAQSKCADDKLEPNGIENLPACSDDLSMSMKDGLIDSCMTKDINPSDNVDDDDVTDDIQIVSEDVRCKMTYASLNKELDRPGWRDFIKRVVNFQINSLKADDLQTSDEARQKMTDRQFFSCQIRQGQRQIAKTFISSLIESVNSASNTNANITTASDVVNSSIANPIDTDSTDIKADTEPGK